MSRLTEALEKQRQLDEMDNKEFSQECSKRNYAPIVELNHSHHQLIDLMLDNPKDSSAKLAEKVGLSKTYIDKLRRTPVFIIEYEAAVAAVHREFRTSLVSQVAQTTKDALIGLSEILTDGEQEASDKIKAAKLLVEGDAFNLFAGGGASKEQSNVNVNINNSAPESAASKFGVTADMLKESSQRRIDKYREGEVVDGEISESEE